jgi:predicted homoserine dehydrogenase-like protein
MKIINVGVIGCGHWGPNFIRNCITIKGVCVKYVSDLSRENLARINALYLVAAYTIVAGNFAKKIRRYAERDRNPTRL